MTTERDETAVEPVTTADIQVFVHTVIADLYAAGLRVHNFAGRATSDVQAQLDAIAEQIDDAIRELRNLAFTHREE